VNYKESLYDLYKKTGILPTFNANGLSKKFQKKLKKKGFEPDTIGNNPKKVIVEASHIYTDHTPGKEHEIGAKIASVMDGFLSWPDYVVENWLFIDDLLDHNPEGKSFDLVGYLEFLEGFGFIPDKIVHESDLISDAEKHFSKLEYFHLITKGKDGVYLKDGNKTLKEGEKFSCSLLDACFYLKKLKCADFTITILPESYKDQQSSTKKILKSLGKNTSPILNVFYTEDLGNDNPNNYNDVVLLAIACDFYLKNLTQSSLNGFLKYCKEHINFSVLEAIKNVY